MWRDVSLKLTEGKPQFVIAPPHYMTEDVVRFVEQRLAKSSEHTLRAG
jgi:hypothetical protein